MSHNKFFISDTHFGHANILTFKNSNSGSPMRVFKDVEEMDEHMVTQWNSVVRPCDRVYHLGDVVMNRKFLPIVERLNGKKVLIMGNHDIFGSKEYLKYFEDVRAYKIFPKERIICSHIPVYSEVFPRWELNVHGHLHDNNVKEFSEKYLNVSVEQINYTPIAFDTILSLLGTQSISPKRIP